jgi:hypothetical protein
VVILLDFESSRLCDAPWAEFERYPKHVKELPLQRVMEGLFSKALIIVNGVIIPRVPGGDPLAGFHLAPHTLRFADVKTAYGTQGQTLTCTLASLASNGARGAASVDNSTGSLFFIDIGILFQITPGGTVAAPNLAVILGAGTVDDDGSPTYPDGYGGTDAGVTLDSPTNLRPVGVVQAPTANVGKRGGPWSLGAVFGGILPERWGVVVLNQTGGALHATEGNHLKLWQGIYHTVT